MLLAIARLMRHRPRVVRAVPSVAALCVLATFAASCHPHDPSHEPAPPAPPAMAAGAARSVTPLPAEPPPGCATLRDVSLSDVVRIEGSTLFYADATRGLTVVDVADAAHPRVVTVVPFAGEPRALFVREGVAWLVLADTDPRTAKDGPRTVVRGFDVRDANAPRAVGEETRAGSPRDAKMVGGYLYVLRGDATHTFVDSFGVRDDRIHGLDAVAIAGTPAQLAASPAGLAVVSVGAEHADVAWLDLSMERPGSLYLRRSVAVPGGVATWEHGEGRIVDAAEDQRVRLVTCATRECAPSEGATLRVVDFAAAEPASTMTSMRVTSHDGLPLTRFADGVLYVTETVASGDDATTLHVVRTEGRTPAFTAHLALRGRISALVPRDTSLVALGTVGSVESQVRVILHDLDVRWPESPRARASVVFGSDWTWSAAMDDDGAVSFDPASHLLAVPFTAWRDHDRRYTTGAQLVDLQRRGAQGAATLASDGPVERAVFLDGHLLTIGPEGVASIDYASTHEPDLRERLLELGPRRPSGR